MHELYTVFIRIGGLYSRCVGIELKSRGLMHERVVYLRDSVIHVHVHVDIHVVIIVYIHARIISRQHCYFPLRTKLFS